MTDNVCGCEHDISDPAWNGHDFDACSASCPYCEVYGGHDADDGFEDCRGEFEYRGFVLPCEREWHANGSHENYSYDAPNTLTGHTPGGLRDEIRYSEGC